WLLGRLLLGARLDPLLAVAAWLGKARRLGGGTLRERAITGLALVGLAAARPGRGLTTILIAIPVTPLRGPLRTRFGTVARR
ncbi:hypothetical protein ACNIV9_28845, partial [Escherichia coli]